MTGRDWLRSIVQGIVIGVVIVLTIIAIIICVCEAIFGGEGESHLLTMLS